VGVLNDPPSGSSLLDFITSMGEKGRRIEEESVWDIFLQVAKP
jgi:hypothetical protein